MAGFYDLPAELRGEICRLVFTERTTLTISRPRTRQPSTQRNQYRLLHINSRLRSEYRPLFYATTDVIVKSIDALIAWYVWMGPKSRALIEHFVVREYLHPAAFYDHAWDIITELQICFNVSFAAAKVEFDSQRMRLELWSDRGMHAAFASDGRSWRRVGDMRLGGRA